MGEKSGSRGLRWMSALLLAAAATPTLLTWRQEAKEQAIPAAPPAVTSDWVDTNALEVQMRPGTTRRGSGRPGPKATPVAALEQRRLATGDRCRGRDAAGGAGPRRGAGRAARRSARGSRRCDALLPHPAGRDGRSRTAEHPRRSPPRDSDAGSPTIPRYGEQWNFRMVKAEEAWEVTKAKAPSSP